MKRIEAYEESGNSTAVYFEYAKIFRRIFIYEMPDLDEDLDDAPASTRAAASSTRVQSSSMNALQWAASAPLRWAGKLFNTVGTFKGERESPQVANPKLQFSIFGKQSE